MGKIEQDGIAKMIHTWTKKKHCDILDLNFLRTHIFHCTVSIGWSFKNQPVFFKLQHSRTVGVCQEMAGLVPSQQGDTQGEHIQKERLNKQV